MDSGVGEVSSYQGFTEDAYRLVFDFQDKYKTAPRLLTILPDGTIENEKDLNPIKEKGLIAYAYPQTTTEVVARKHTKSPFVRERENGSYALVQTWPTNYNDKFRADFSPKTTNPSPSQFIPQAVEEFKETVVQLFGAGAKSHDILYCHKKTINSKLVYIGTVVALRSFLKANPSVVQELDITELTETGFVCQAVNQRNEKRPLKFSFASSDTMCALYTMQGWEVMACITPLDQFVENRQLGPRRDAVCNS